MLSRPSPPPEEHLAAIGGGPGSSHLPLVELQRLRPHGQLLLQSGQRALEDALLFLQLLNHQQLGVHLGATAASHPEDLHTSNRAPGGWPAETHLGFKGEDLVGQLFLLLLQQLVDLVGFDSLAHQLEVGVVLLPQLLQQAAVLFLHVLEGLAGHVHLAQKSFLLLPESRTGDSVSGRLRKVEKRQFKERFCSSE